MKCVIFGGADIYDYSKICLPQEKCFVIAADRGYIHCEKLGIVPDVIIGDFDSLDKDVFDGIENSSDYPQPIVYPSDKDYTDTFLAVKYACEHGSFSDFIIFGGTGGRFGHTFTNVQMLSYMKEKGLNCTLCDENYELFVITAADGKKYFPTEDDDDYEYISLFAISDTAEIILAGLKYSGRFTFDRKFSLGVSNKTLADATCRFAEVLSGEVLVVREKFRS